MARYPTRLEAPHGPVLLHRDSHGVIHLRARHIDDVHWALGYCHAMDRGLQILLTRIVGRGEVSRWLDGSEAGLKIDLFFRRHNFIRGVEAVRERLTPRARAAADAYCLGINHRFSRHGLPWELRLMRLPFLPWTLRDVMVVGRLMGYVGLAQTEATVEHLLVECLQHGLDRARLEELFPGRIEGLDEELIRRVRLAQPVVPAELRWAVNAPAFTGSNNWAVAGSRTASGRPIFCNDPHLEINRLPPVWYEVVLEWPHRGRSRYAMGATVPGVPGIIVGRTSDLAWGVTYAFMDVVDSWIEHCRDGRYRRGNEWVPFHIRRETIQRKKRPPVEVTYYENQHGLLEGDPAREGYYLATAWSGADPVAAAASVEAVCAVLEASDVEQGRAALGRLVNGAWNWVLADRHGNLGYQMAGHCPRRRDGISGLVPLPGWDPANDWQGFVPPEELPRLLNPPDGIIITANNVKIEGLGSGKKVRGRRHGPYRPDLVVLDDVENDEQVMSPHQRDKLTRWIDRAVLKLGPPDGSMDVIMAGTVLHHDAVLVRLSKRPGWRVARFRAILKWPERMDLWERWEELLLNDGEAAADAFLARHRAEMEAGAVLNWAAMQPLEWLMKVRAESHAAFESEYQGNPVSERSPFRDLQFWVARNPSWVFFGAIDPSLGKQGGRGDPSAILVGGLDAEAGVLDVVEASIRPRLPDTIIADAIALQRDYHCQLWFVEAVQFQELLRELLMQEAAKAGVPMPCVPITPLADKRLRIERLQAPVAAGLIRFHPSHTTLIDQLQQWPEADHDDGPDALEMLWTHALQHARSALTAERLRGLPLPPGGEHSLRGYRL